MGSGANVLVVHIRDYNDPVPGALERKSEKDIGNGHHNTGVADNTATTTGASTV